jgi:hypothetical protein
MTMKKAIVSLLCLLVSLPAAFAATSDGYGMCAAHFIRPAEPLSLYGQPVPGLMGRPEGAGRVEIWDANSPVMTQPLQVSHVGAGIFSSTPTGDFDIVLDSALLGKQLAARVYDTDDPSTAHYRFDSEIFQFQNDNSTLSRKLTFSAPKSLVSNPDSDGDGLTDLEETSGALGFITDPFKVDTDGDGINDDVELVYGLDPTRQLEVVLTSAPATSPSSVVPLTQDWFVGWPASTNPYVLYTLEMVQDLLDIQEGEFPSAAAAQRVVRSKQDIHAAQTNWQELVTEWMQTNSIGFFRVRQDLQPLPDTANDASDGGDEVVEGND